MKPQYSYESFYVKPSYISIVAVTPLGTQKNVLNTYKPKKKKINTTVCMSKRMLFIYYVINESVTI